MKKVIAFDSWKGGVRHFNKIANPLHQKGYKLILIHIGSWGHEKKYVKEETIDNLTIRDISFYEDAAFSNILKMESPDAVIFLSTRAFAHMAFNRLARWMGIPTVHFYHGIIGVQATSSTASPDKINFLNQIRLIAKKASKNILILWPCYIKSMIITGIKKEDIYWFIREVYQKSVSGYHGSGSPDSSTDSGCVYIDADIEHMEKTYNISRQRIYTIGNPDLINFDMKESDVGAHNQKSNKVVYIDSAQAVAGFTFSSIQEYVNYICELKNKFEEKGYELAIKLHPASKNQGLKNILEFNGVRIIEDIDFLYEIKNCSLTIAEPSSAALIPALIGAPIYLNNIGSFAKQKYGKVLTSYTYTTVLPELSMLPEYPFNFKKNKLSNDFEKWISNNLGPLPVEEFGLRAANAIIETINIYHENRN
jgi:hypothetical protein